MRRSLARLSLLAFSVAGPARAQSGQSSGIDLSNLHHGLAVGVAIGVSAAAGVGITYLVLHNRGVLIGCIAEADGKRTLIGSNKKVHPLQSTDTTLPVGERVRLQGRKSGSGSFQVKKVLKDYGPCR